MPKTKRSDLNRSSIWLIVIFHILFANNNSIQLSDSKSHEKSWHNRIICIHFDINDIHWRSSWSIHRMARWRWHPILVTRDWYMLTSKKTIDKDFTTFFRRLWDGNVNLPHLIQRQDVNSNRSQLNTTPINTLWTNWHTSQSVGLTVTLARDPRRRAPQGRPQLADHHWKRFGVSPTTRKRVPVWVIQRIWCSISHIFPWRPLQSGNHLGTALSLHAAWLRARFSHCC